MNGTKNRRTNKELFLDKLKVKSNSGQKLVGNKALRSALKWDEKRYERVKNQLVGADLVIQGRGRGGSVGLAQEPDTKGLSLFVSYSHVDTALKDQLVHHLKPLERMNLVETWNDEQIEAGKEWEKAISNELNDADIILLLISVDFINSGYCYEIEMENALERHDNGDARVIPIILRNCLWQQMPFGKLQALPSDGKAVVTWGSQDEALTDVAKEILKAAEQILNEKQ